MSSIVLYVIVGYWVVSAAIMLSSLLVDCRDKSLDLKAELLNSLPSPRREFAKAFGLLGLVIVAPFLLPYCLLNEFFGWLRERAFFTWLKRTHRENVYEKLHPMNVPKPARDHFELRAPELLNLGFQEIGRYQLKPDPAPSYGYCFHSPDGRTVGVLGNMFDATYFSFSTTFADGLALETASVEETPNLARANESINFRVIFAPDESVADVYVRHEAAVAFLESQFGTHALALEPGQFHEVLTYEGRIFSQFLYEVGELDAPPPPAVLPQPGVPAPEPAHASNFDELAAAAPGAV